MVYSMCMCMACRTTSVARLPRPLVGSIQVGHDRYINSRLEEPVEKKSPMSKPGMN